MANGKERHDTSRLTSSIINSREKLGLKEDEFFGPESLYLSPWVHDFEAPDGRRFTAEAVYKTGLEMAR